jgi:UDP-GlcNAc:undecaprenyl-phosphate/decaprenyl-phosphate GlcNAc-1-phosphate transferase
MPRVTDTMRGLSLCNGLPMESLTLTAPVAFVASLLLTAVVRTLARRWGIVDWPDGLRKLHARPVPLWGGVAVYGAAVLGLLAAQFGPGGPSQDFRDLSTAWVIAAGFVCFVGSIDDRFNLASRVKLALQIGSVLPLVALGYYVDRVVAFGYPIELGWLGVPLTILWLVGCINALNLIDGMDGLASTVGLSTAAMIAMIAASQGFDHVAAMAAVLAASLLGFLLYNLPPASIFLGDSGSMVIGLTLGVLGIQGSLKTSATLAITAPAVAMTLPLLDTLAAIVRRRLTGRSFDSPDRLHIHHRLLARGWNPWQVLCLIGAICLTTGAAATAATIFRRDALAWITAMTLVVLMIRLRLFGHEEFALAKEAVVRLLRPGLRLLAVLAHGRKIRASAIATTDAAPVSSLTVAPGLLNLNRELSASGLGIWDLLVREVQAWKIREVEFCWLQDFHPRRIHWIDPTRPVEPRRPWSLSVSLPGYGNVLCELRAVGIGPRIDTDGLAVLEALLKTFGTHMAAHAEQIFGPLLPLEEPATLAVHPDHHRQAA